MRARLPLRPFEHLESRRFLAATLVVGNKLTLPDVDGDVVTIALSGPGQLFQTSGAGGLLFGHLFTQSTTSASRMSITVRKSGAGDGAVSIGGFTAGAAMGALIADRADFSQSISLADLVKDVRVRDLSGLQLTMGGTTGVTKFRARSIVNSAVVLGERLATSVTLFDASGANITVGAIGSLVVKDDKSIPGDGDFRDTSRLQLGGVVGVAKTLGSAKIPGTFEGVADISGAVGSFTAGNFLSTSWTATGAVGAIKAGGALDSVFGVGLGLGTLTVGDIGGSSITFATARTLKFRNIQQSQIVGTGVDAKGVTIGAFSAALLQGAAISYPAGSLAPAVQIYGHMNSFRAKQVEQSTILGGSVGSVTITGDSALALPGLFRGSLSMGNDQRSVSLNSLTVKGEFSGIVDVLGSAGTIKLGAIGLASTAGIFVGVPLNVDRQSLMDNGLPGTDSGLFAPVGGTLKSFVMPKPPASSGFSTLNPNIGRFFVVAKIIGSISAFNAFGKLTDQIGEPWGFGAQVVNKGKIIFAGGKQLSAKDLTSVTLQQAAADDPTLPITFGLGFYQAPFYTTPPPVGSDQVFVRLYS